MLYMDVGGQEDDKRYIPSNEHLKEMYRGKITKLSIINFFSKWKA